jgi:predicted nucleotidyltransferase
MMTDFRNRWIEEARLRVTDAVAPFGVRVWLFGSCARGTPGRFSDIDIAVSADGPLPPQARAAIDDAIEASTILCDVDIVDLAGISETLRSRILAEAIPWTGQTRN